MKQVSTLFDALRNEKFAVAVKDDNGTRYYGVDGAGREWAQWANAVDTKSLESSQLPAGVIQGPFKNTTDIALKSLINSLGYSQPQSGVISDSKAYAYKSSYHTPNGARVPAVMDTPISHFTTSQYTSAVNYKALAIRTQIKEGSFLFEARANNYAFNFEKSMYNSMPSKAEIKTLRQRIDNNLGRSTERRLGLKLKNAILETSGRNNIGVIYGLETKSLGNSFEEKSIGQRIGGGARLGRRAGRAAFARFDPKAWDGDGDGIVQEGTPFQRPAVPGVNDRSTGGKVNIEEATAAWEKLDTGKRGQVAKRIVVSKPAVSRQGTKPKPGLASRTQQDIDKEVSKQITDEVRDVLSGKSSPTDLRALVQGLGPDGGGELTRNQEDKINNHIDDFENDEYENMEDFMSDISNVLQNRPSGSKNPGQSGMRSRVSTARTQRQVEGLASASSRSKKKSIARAIPGRDKVSDKDGQIWDSLTDEQKDLTETQAQQAYKDLMDQIKTQDSDWWRSFLAQNSSVKKKQKIDVDGNEWNQDSRIAGEAFTSYQLAIEDAIDVMKGQLSEIESQIAKATDPDSKKKLENKAKRLSREIDRAQETIDDLLTFDQMFKNNDWSLLEHIHPENRQKILGTKVPKAQQDNYKKVFGDSKPPMKLNEPSTIFEKEIISDKPRLGERADRKLADFARRITRPNPERAERRRLRKLKKAGRSGFDVSEEEIKPQSNIKKRINKAKRAVKRRVGKSRNETKIAAAIDAGKATRIFERKEDGSLVLTKESVDLLDEAFTAALKENGRGDFKGQKGANMLLGYLWENNGFNREATLVSEDEAIGLMDNGWFPIKRGVSTEAYAEDYLVNPRRRISGQQGEMEGVGEYWSQGPTSQWTDSMYWGSSSSKGGVFGFMSPDYRVASAEDRSRMVNEYAKFSEAISGVIEMMPKGEAEKMDPADFIREVRAALSRNIADGDPILSGEVGQMWSSIISAYENADGAEKAKLWNVITFMSQKLRKQQRWDNYVPLMLGYDAIDTGGSNSARVGGKNDGKQIIVFNRQGLAVFDRPINVQDVNEILVKADKK